MGQCVGRVGCVGRQDITHPTKFSLVGRYDGRVVKVVDGDTIHVAMRFRQRKPEIFCIRLEGLDCPEIGAKAPSVGEAQFGAEVTRLVTALLLNQKVTVMVSHKNDKWGGRWLGEVFMKRDQFKGLALPPPCPSRPPPPTVTQRVPCPPRHKISLNTFLVHHRLAKSYYGKTKQPWTVDEIQIGCSQTKNMIKQLS